MSRLRSDPVLLTSLVAVAGTTAVLPVMHVQLDEASSFMMALVATVAVFDIMLAYLLLGEFTDYGERRSLVMAAAYVWSLVVMLGYALAFPSAVVDDPPLALTPSTAPYLYVLWHCGFALLLGLAWAPWPTWLARVAPVRGRRSTGIAGILIAVASGATMVTLLCVFAQRLPELIMGLDTSRLTSYTAPVAIPVVALSLVLAVRGTWHRAGPERWTSVAILACLCDLVLTYASQARYTVGWYAGRSLPILAAGVVLFAMLASFRRLKAQAERDALLDPLTGLLNRRGALVALDVLIAQARRRDDPLGVLALDLDFFKTINDRDGHEAGDAVLTAVGRVLIRSSRAGDLAARIGGEEFLVVLHDTSSMETLMAGERLRDLISCVSMDGVSSPVTASVGVTVLMPQDVDAAALLRRADAALYDAKRGGRNRVESRFLESFVGT